MKNNFKLQTNLGEQINDICKAAKDASYILMNADSELKNKALERAAKSIQSNQDKILEANSIDLNNAKNKGVSGAIYDRLELNEKRVESMAKGLEEVTELSDPVGKTLAEFERPNGLKIRRISIPLGVIGIIYESRPNVTADAAALCIKSGNAAILRGGSESFNSSRAIMDCIQEALIESGLPGECAQLIPTQDREAVGMMLQMDRYIDVIVPRGGKDLIERVSAESKIPVIKHLDGNCHTYIHAKADPGMAMEVTINGKLRRTGVCNATESLLIDKEISKVLLPQIIKLLIAEDCEIKGDETVQKVDPEVKPAVEDDWYTEYLDKVISIKVVDGVEEAINHINKYGSHHTDAIVTGDSEAARKFLQGVDSAVVMHNASTQFTDGGEFGMGAEIGISTNRLHARGPVGLEQLTTYKYVVEGNGQIRSG